MGTINQQGMPAMNTKVIFTIAFAAAMFAMPLSDMFSSSSPLGSTSAHAAAGGNGGGKGGGNGGAGAAGEGGGSSNGNGPSDRGIAGKENSNAGNASDVAKAHANQNYSAVAVVEKQALAAAEAAETAAQAESTIDTTAGDAVSGIGTDGLQ